MATSEINAGLWQLHDKLAKLVELPGWPVKRGIPSREEMAATNKLLEIVSQQSGADQRCAGVTGDIPTTHAASWRMIERRLLALHHYISLISGCVSGPYHELGICRLISEGVIYKLARCVIPPETTLKNAMGLTLGMLRRSEKVDQHRLEEYIGKYDEFERGWEFFYNAARNVPYCVAPVFDAEGMAIVYTHSVLLNCVKELFGEDHPEFTGFVSVLSLLKDLAVERQEDLIVEWV